MPSTKRAVGASGPFNATIRTVEPIEIELIITQGMATIIMRSRLTMNSRNLALYNY